MTESPLTRDEHIQLAPQVLALRQGVVDLGRTHRWCKRNLNYELNDVHRDLRQLRSRLNILWSEVDAGARIYRVEVIDYFQNQIDAILNDRCLKLSAYDFAAWMHRQLVQKIIDTIRGRVPEETYEDALLLNRSFTDLCAHVRAGTRERAQA